MFELSFNHIMKYMGTHLLFKEMNFQIFSGERVGIVGQNGSGKSTILKLIAGIEPLNIYIGSWSVGYDYGWIYKPKDVTIAYLEQIPKYPEHYKVRDVLRAAFEETLALEHQMRALEHQMSNLEEDALEKALNLYANITAAYEAKGGYEIEEKLGRICTGLNFDDSFLNKPFALLSGGEQTTVVLGKILLDKPDILLLDEPTNHLDTDAIEWLEDYLSTYQGILVLVSHDRYFLDKVVNKVIEIEDMQAQSFKGNYSSYVNQKEEQMRIQYEDYLEQKKQIQQMENKVKQLRDWAIRADNNKFFKRAASMQIKLAKMEHVKRPIFDKPGMRLDLSTSSRTGEETIVCVNVSKKFSDKVIFKETDLMVRFGERAALVGPNGSGKSTLIKMLLGELTADFGELRLGSNAKVAYLPQKITFSDENVTLVENFREGLDISEGKAREYLARFMFYGKRVYTEVKALSGGERTRLKLAKLLYDDVNLLILDEPTNHLDIDAIETLEEALEDFDGTILFISHDRYFINKLKPTVVAVENHKLNRYDGDYDFYKIEREKFRNTPVPVFDEPLEKKVLNKFTPSKTSTESKTVNYVKKERLEKEIATIEYELVNLEEAMLQAMTDYEILSDLSNLKGQMQNQLDDLLEHWIQC